MIITHDVYSETNPAFCAFVIAAFVAAYASVKSEGPEMVTIYASVPIAISAELGSTFEGTNKNTGLLEWIARSPGIQIGLGQRLNESMSIVTDGLRFALFSGVISLNENTRLRLGTHKLKQSLHRSLSGPSKAAIQRSARLGLWFAADGSSRSIFESLGLTV